MSTRKTGANRNDQNFIRRCIVEDADWSIERVASHLQMEVEVTREWFDYISKQIEDEGNIPDPADDDGSPAVKKKKKDKKSAEEEFS